MISLTATGRRARRIAVERQRRDRVVRGIDDEDLVKFVGQVGGVAHVIDGLADRPEFGHGDEIAPHEAAGAIFGIGEACLHRPAFLGRGRIQHDALCGAVEIFEHVHGIVGIELGDGGREMRGSPTLRRLRRGRYLRGG